MDSDEYQRRAASTRGVLRPLGATETEAVAWALGAAGEAGEVLEEAVHLVVAMSRVSNTVERGVFHGHGLDRDALVKEIGGMLWYTAALCTTLDVTLGDVMRANLEELARRYPGGHFTVEDSVADYRRRAAAREAGEQP